MEFLRDPIWQAVGVLLAVLVPGAIYLVQRERKALLYDVLTDISLVSVRQQSLMDLEVRYRGYVMLRPWLLVVRVVNAGNKPIVAADYETSIELNFADGTKVLSAEIFAMQPDRLRIDAKIESETSIQFSKVLLNPGDSFQCRALVDGTGRFEVLGRIAGVSKIEKMRDRTWMGPVLALFCMLLIVVTIFLSPKPISVSVMRPEELPYGVAIALLMAIAASALVWTSTSRLRRATNSRSGVSGRPVKRLRR